MRRNMGGLPFLIYLAILLPYFVTSCGSKHELLGKWREPGSTATIEFLEDGSFEAVDNMGMAVRGNYTLLGNGNIRFEIAHQGSSNEVIDAKLSTRGGELVISFEAGKVVERYVRVK